MAFENLSLQGLLFNIQRLLSKLTTTGGFSSQEEANEFFNLTGELFRRAVQGGSQPVVDAAARVYASLAGLGIDPSVIPNAQALAEVAFGGKISERKTLPGLSSELQRRVEWAGLTGEGEPISQVTEAIFERAAGAPAATTTALRQLGAGAAAASSTLTGNAGDYNRYLQEILLPSLGRPSASLVRGPEIAGAIAQSAGITGELPQELLGPLADVVKALGASYPTLPGRQFLEQVRDMLSQLMGVHPGDIEQFLRGLSA